MDPDKEYILVCFGRYRLDLSVCWCFRHRVGQETRLSKEPTTCRRVRRDEAGLEAKVHC